MNLSSLNLECKYKNNMQCIHNIQNTYFAEIEQIEFVQQYKCLFGLIFRNQTFQTLFTFSEQELFLASIFSFYWLHVCWKITLSKRSFHVRKAVRENLLFIFFSFHPKYVFILLLIRAFKKFYLYMHFYVAVSACMLVHVNFSFHCFA